LAVNPTDCLRQVLGRHGFNQVSASPLG
jgi:hypothetical protein